MGSSSSKNEVKRSVKTLTSVATDTFQGCGSSGSNFAGLKVKCEGPGTTCNIDCNINQSVVIDSKCAIASSSNTQLRTKLDLEATQQAKAVGNAFQLSSTKTSNLNELYTELSNSIFDAYTGTCGSNAINSTTVDAEAKDAANLKLNCNINQTIDVMSDCIMKNDKVTKITNEIIDLVDQYSESKTKGWLTWLIYIAIAVIVLVFGIIALVVLLLAFGVIGGKKGGGDSKEEGMSTTDVINLAAQLI